MSNPPENIAPSELWNSLVTLPRPHRFVDFPRYNPTTGQSVGQVAMWVLTQEEQIASAAAADRVAKLVLKQKQIAGEENIGYKSVYNNAASVEILYRACRDHNDIGRPAFPSPSHLRKISVDELGVLMRHYLTLQYEIGPIIGSLSKEEMDAWIARLVEGGQQFPLDLLSSEATTDLLMYMARRLYKSPTDNTSVGTPLDESSTDEIPPDVSDIN